MCSLNLKTFRMIIFFNPFLQYSFYCDLPLSASAPARARQVKANELRVIKNISKGTILQRNTT